MSTEEDNKDGGADDPFAGWAEALEEQKRTNRLLQSVLYGGVGFVLGLIVMQLIVRVRLF